MLLSKEKIEKIRQIIERGYARLILEVVGENALTSEQKKYLVESGININQPDSLLKLLYFNHLFNTVDGKNHTPKSAYELKSQVHQMIPDSNRQKFVLEHLNDNFANQINKLKNNLTSKVENVILNSNLEYSNKVVSDDDSDSFVKENDISDLKAKLADISQETSRDWKRISTTELSNSISLGGVDRVLSSNEGKDSNDIYVYKLIVEDNKTCAYCRKFFQDSDGTPALYSLSALMANGTNVGRKQAEWLPTCTPIHPNCRETSIIELPKGFKVDLGGNMVYVGKAEWESYLQRKVRR